MPKRRGEWKASGFGERLRELREAAGLTQARLAELADCAMNTIARVERGEHEPAWPLVLLLAKVLDVTTEAFVKQPKQKAESPKRGRGRPRKDSHQ